MKWLDAENRPKMATPHAENRPKMAKPCLVQGMHKALVFLDTLWVFRLRQL